MQEAAQMRSLCCIPGAEADITYAFIEKKDKEVEVVKMNDPRLGVEPKEKVLKRSRKA